MSTDLEQFIADFKARQLDLFETKQAAKETNKRLRGEAMARGDVTYTSRESCKYGHAPIRYVISNNCVECRRSINKNNLENAKRWQRNNRERFLAGQKRYYREVIVPRDKARAAERAKKSSQTTT